MHQVVSCDGACIISDCLAFTPTVLSKRTLALLAVRSFWNKVSSFSRLIVHLVSMGTSNSKPTGQASTPKEYLQLIKACTKRAQKRISTPNHSTSPKFNFEQCKYLVDKLGLAIEAAKLFLAQSNAQYLDHLSIEDSVKCLEGFKLLYALSREVESFTLNCGKDTWIPIALTLANMSEFILSVGFNLELWRIAFGARENSTPIKVESIYHDEVQSVAEKASDDLASLKRSLKGVMGSNKYKMLDQKLAAFILHRVDKKLIPIFHEDSVDSSRSNLSEAVLSMKQKDLKLLGRGSSASVFSWTWLGVELVVKEFHGKDNPDFMKEVSIMKGLIHPNIISVLCFAKNNRKSFIVMERMDGDLESLMKARWDICGANKPLFCIFEAVDIMLQIGTGMLYLHESRIVHRDLKSMNILVRIAKATNDGEVEYVVAKVADFGVSKTKLKSITDSHPTPNMGTTRWMAPELLKFTDAELQKISMPKEVEDENVKYPFKCDIYSFAMVCYEVLSGEYPFYNTSSHMKVKEMVLTGIRPGLPDGCPIKLKDLIERCWSMDPEGRPSFDDICKELRQIKCSLLTLSTSLANTSSGTSSMTTMNDSNIDHHQDECGRPTNSAVSVAIAADGSVSEFSDVDYCQQSISSIDAVQKLVAEDPNMLLLNDQQCRYLSKKLTETGCFLRAKSSLVKIRDSTDIRRMPLLHLHFAVKRAEKLVRGCCCEQESWLEAAVTLSHVKEAIKDILLDLRWWTSMVDIAITSVKGKSSGQTTRLLEILENAEEDFEELLKELHTPNNGLVRAASEDESELLGKVREVETSFVGGGRSAVQKHEYLLAVHVRSRLENSEAETVEDLNEYEDGKLIGFGGFGVVQDVRWMGRRCALKILNRTCKEEATKLRKFQHPHIVKFFRYFEAPFRQTPNGRSRDTPQGTPGSDSGPVYRGTSQSHILMELLPMDLSQYLGKLQDTASFTVGSKGKPEHTGGAPLPVDVALDVMLQSVKAMWHLNSKDVAHRDVKPSNLLVRPVSFDEVPELTARGYVWAELADLGLAKTEAFSSAFSTQPKEIGSRMYGAPEVFNADIISEKSYPRKADVWSFGIMFCEVLTGKPPFPGVADGTMRMTILQEKIKKGLRPKLPENCPDYLKFIIESCWHLKPEDRPNFGDLWRLMRIAQAQSLGLIQKDHDLFFYRPRTGLKKLRSVVKRERGLGFQPRSSFKRGNSKSREVSVSRAESECKPLGYLVNQLVPLDEDISASKLDVIFFEGNVGRTKGLSCKDTWVQRNNPDVWWPRDWLPKDLGDDIRVLLLEYCISDDEDGVDGVLDRLQRLLVFSERWNWRNTWERPIVLVGHSLGCVIIEHLVVALDRKAKLTDEVEIGRAKVAKAFLTNLAGCFFYAPLWTGLVRSDDLLMYVFGGLTYSEGLFADLCLDSTMLKSLSEVFVQVKPEHMKLTALIEAFHTKGRNVVPPGSMLGFDGTVVELEESNHIDVCKPTDKQHLAYKELLRFIVEVLEDSKLSMSISS